MKKKMLIDSQDQSEIRIAILEENKLIDFESENVDNNRTKGNIYLAKIVRVEPSLQAAFVDFGFEKHGFLAYNEIHPDYFKIPTSDKKKLLAQELEASKNLPVEDEDEFENENNDTNRDSSSDISGKDKKGFLDRFFDFFNYKPIEDYPAPKFRRRKQTSTMRKNKNIIYHRKYSIQEVIKSNQVILIQVVKEERGNKGAAVTTRLSLAGKYCVLMPNTNKGGGISRKIIDVNLRKKLKDIVNKLNIKKGMGVIIRTAGEKMGLKEIKRDYNSLIKLWNEITLKTVKSNAPCLIHEEDNLLKRCLRDYFDETFTEVIINSKNTFSKAKLITKQFTPSSVKLLKLFNNKSLLFSNYKLEKQLLDLNNPIVNLKSGGYLVINQTEALVAIDINSGRSTKQRNIEDTAYKTNLEAAEEICKQIKIRDLAGLIVIDFIDMIDRGHNVRVEKKVRDLIRYDRARVQCGRISSFGLMELSRQRLKVTNDLEKSTKCKFCNGYGSVISNNFLIRQLNRVYKEYKENDKLENIFVLVNENLHKNVIDKVSKNNLDFKKNIFIYPKLEDFEYLVCSDKEILLSNSHNNTKFEDFANFINFNKKKGIITKDTSSKKSKIQGRISYREKAESFNSQLPKEQKGEVSILQKDKKEEKKQGWWSQ